MKFDKTVFIVYSYFRSIFLHFYVNISEFFFHPATDVVTKRFSAGGDMKSP